MYHIYSIDEIIENIKNNDWVYFPNNINIDAYVVRPDAVYGDLDENNALSITLWTYREYFTEFVEKLKQKIRQDIKDAIRTGEILNYPMVFSTCEGFSLNENARIISELLNEFKEEIPDIFDRVIFISSSFNYNRDTYRVNGVIRFHDITFTFIHLAHSIPNKFKNEIDYVIPQEKIFEKTFGCLLARPSYDRVKIAHHLISNYDTDTLLLCNNDGFRHILCKVFENIDINRYQNQIMIEKTINNESDYHEYVINDLLDKTKNIFVDIVSETLFYEEDNVWFTEKTVYPMLLGLPFITSSTAGIYKLYHSFGFKTFSDFWDESFDDIIDHEERNKKFISTIDYIASTYNTEEKRQEAYKKMLPILQHNRRHMLHLLNNPREVLDYIKHTDSAIAELETILKSAYPNS